MREVNLWAKTVALQAKQPDAEVVSEGGVNAWRFAWAWMLVVDLSFVLRVT